MPTMNLSFMCNDGKQKCNDVFSKDKFEQPTGYQK